MRKASMEKAVTKLNQIAKNKDLEVAHIDADAVLCELLKELGYNDVVDAFNAVRKWYA